MARKYLIAAICAATALVIVSPTTSGGQPQESIADECSATYRDGRALLKEAWDNEGWRQRNPVKKSQGQQLDEVWDCLEGKPRKKLRAYSEKVKGQFYEWRGYRLVANTDCGFGHHPQYYYTGGAVSCGTIGCESSGNWRQENMSGSSASGAYQILDSTWRGYGGGQYASRAKYGTPREQSMIAREISHDGDQWVC